MLFRLGKHLLDDFAVAEFVHVFCEPAHKEFEFLKVDLPVSIRVKQGKRVGQSAFI
jgi:hypothetical protein